jgi:hypothetical protein
MSTYRGDGLSKLVLIPDIGLDLVCVLDSRSTGHVAVLHFLPNDSRVLRRPVEIAPHSGPILEAISAPNFAASASGGQRAESVFSVISQTMNAKYRLILANRLVA